MKCTDPPPSRSAMSTQRRIRTGEGMCGLARHDCAGRMRRHPKFALDIRRRKMGRRVVVARTTLAPPVPRLPGRATETPRPLLRKSAGWLLAYPTIGARGGGPLPARRPPCAKGLCPMSQKIRLPICRLNATNRVYANICRVHTSVNAARMSACATLPALSQEAQVLRAEVRQIREYHGQRSVGYAKPRA